MFRSAAVVSILTVVTACGGGGGDAGDAGEFSVFPSEFTLKAAKGDESCVFTAGTVIDFVINGGQPPFRIVNPVPQYLTANKTEATGKDPNFRITTRSGCLEDMGITVLDAFSQPTIATITIEKGDAAE